MNRFKHYKAIAEEHNLLEEDVETLCEHYDKKDLIEFKHQLGYIFWSNPGMNKVLFLIDLLEYINYVMKDYNLEE